MKPFDFDELTIRRGTASLKWDTTDDPEVIPLWVADMDFRTAPAVTLALAERVASGIFGYVDIPQDYYRALSSWFLRKHGWHINKDHVIPTTGVVPAVSAIIKAFTKPGDGVILQTPAYNCFFSSIRNNGCRQIDNPLLIKELENGFSYDMDFVNLEVLASDPRNKVLILCNPHNPTGRVWTREELTKVRDICNANNVKVISDEIHCELVHPGFEYTPFAYIDPTAVVCCSPSKAFNTAGLQIANIVASQPDDRYAINRAINDNEAFSYTH
ncbi:MAG: aminotransferase class I/II-fold pyridoxal phosphate-dependent enzyme, partial [Muribaculaceae bacterium]|nr:aminotransferase class I/II-fold pyridoxal phosphate-dependent enzyme [Muribaculaceae bacterium]